MITREKAKEMLVALGIAEPTEEQITGYLNNVNGEVKKEQEKAAQYKKDADRAKELEERIEELEGAGATEAERVQKALERANEVIADLKRTAVTAEVRAIFGAAGLTDEDCKDYVDIFAGLELDVAKLKASALVKTIENTRETTKKKTEEELLDGTQGGGVGGQSGNKEETQAEKNAKAYAEAKANADKASGDILSQYGIGGN